MNFLASGVYNPKDPINLNKTIEKIFSKFNVINLYFYNQKTSNHPWEIPLFKEKFTEKIFKNDKTKMLPVDEDLLEKMNECEVTVLRMMDRFDQNSFIKLSYEKRKQLYLEYLAYSLTFLKKKEIDFVLLGNMPHAVYDYILYCLCKIIKIPCVFFCQSMTDIYFIESDWEESAPKLKEIYLKMKKQYFGTNHRRIKLNYPFKEIYDSQVSKIQDPTPYYMKKSNFFLKYFSDLFNNFFWNPIIFFKSIANFKYILNRIYVAGLKVYRITTSYRLSRFYEKNSINPDLKKDFIYFPLHMQPERSTSPMAGKYVDQILIIKMLSGILPKNIFLYVKENPKQDSFGRDTDFYKEILNFPNVRLVSKSSNSFRLIENSVAVATATGTAGWEALFRNTPVLMFGHEFFQYASGVFQINTLDDCQKALTIILRGEGKPNLLDMKVFLKALEKVANIGYLSPDYKKVSKISREDNQNFFGNVLEKIIKENNK